MKSTSAEVRRRVEEVYRLRLGGAEFSDILQFASAPEQNWNVSERQIWNYVAAADKLVKERFDARADHLLARHLLQRRQLYAHAMGAGDFRTALAVLVDEAKLEGLYPATRTELTGKEGRALVPAVEMTEEEKRAAVAAIVAAHSAPSGAGSNHPTEHGPGNAG
jgi:hypothetical protein